MLAYLYRAKGDLTEARKMAEKTELDYLVEDILLKAADWKALAARPKAMGVYPIEKASYRASFARLSGNRKQFEAAVADLKEKGYGQEAYLAALTLIANGRASEGITLLGERERDQHFEFVVLCARLQYREAMALVDRTPADDSRKKDLEVHQVRMLYRLGEHDKARALLARLGEQLREGRGYKWSSKFLSAEYDVGLKDQALEHCAFLLAVPDPQERWEPGLVDYLGELFPNTRGSVVWFQVLRHKFPKESILAVLRRLRDLLKGKIATATVNEWIEQAQKELDSLKMEERSERLIAFAEVAVIAGFDALARSLLEKADTHESLIRLGDLLAQKQEWLRATEYYRQAWRKSLRNDWDSADSLPLYLAGAALVKGGRVHEGKRLIEQAHLAPLGSTGIRHGFFNSLMERGHREAARREIALVARLGTSWSSEYSMASYHLALAAAARKDYFQAAAAYEQTMFSNLTSVQVYFGLVGATTMSSEIHRLRAYGLLAPGRMRKRAGRSN